MESDMSCLNRFRLVQTSCVGRIREFELAGNLSREGIRFLNAFRHGEGVGGGLYWYAGDAADALSTVI